MAYHGEDVDIDPSAVDDMDVDPSSYVTYVSVGDSRRIGNNVDCEGGWEGEGDVVYDQYEEPFCWALSTAQVMVYRRSIILKAPLIHYSSQELMNSVRPFAEEAYTLSIERAFEFIVYNKISESDDVPFLGKKDVCAARTLAQSDRALGIFGYFSADYPSEDVLIAFLKYGPVVIGLISSPEFGSLIGDNGNNIYQGALNFENYREKKDLTGHAVVLVGDGYDSTKGQFYWRIKNSGGEDWGVKGFARIVRDCSIPAGYRGMTIISACIPIFNHESELGFFNEVSRVDGVRFTTREYYERRHSKTHHHN